MGSIISSECHTFHNKKNKPKKNILVEKKNKLSETDILKKNNQELTEKNKLLEEKLNSYENPTFKLDNKKINEIVEGLLSNKNINVGLLPDSIESKLYENVIKIVLSILQETLKNAKIDLLGHEIKMSLNTHSN